MAKFKKGDRVQIVKVLDERGQPMELSGLIGLSGNVAEVLKIAAYRYRVELDTENPGLKQYNGFNDAELAPLHVGIPQEIVDYWTKVLEEED